MKVSVHEQRVDWDGAVTNGSIAFQGEFPDAASAMKELLPRFGARHIYSFDEPVADAELQQAIGIVALAKWDL